MSKFKFLIFLSSIIFSPVIHAEDLGVITLTTGEAQIFRNPSNTAYKTDNQVVYENKYYQAEKAKVGAKVYSENIIHTGNNGKVRIVYPNSDQLVVGPGSSMLIQRSPDPQKPGAAATALKLIYGKVRATVGKADDHKIDFTIKTPAATAGVRGTDFVVEHNPSFENSTVSVLRGLVQVESAKKTIADVKPGSTVEVDSKKTEEVKTSQERLTDIQNFSTAKMTPEESKEIPPATAKEVQEIEKKALQKTLADLKKEDPKLYEKMSTTKTKDISEVSSAVVSKLMETAPKESPEKRKKLQEQLQQMDDSVYKKYFEEKKEEKK